MSATATERFSEQKIQLNIDGNWTGTRAWDVIGYDSPDDACNAVISQFGASIGSGFPSFPQLACTNLGMTENKLTKGIVVANYAISTILANDPNPLLRAPFIQWKRAKQSVPVDTDINGNPILNSAGDAFSSNPTRTISVRFLTIKRWEASYNQSLASQYVDTTNSDSFTICGVTLNPGQAYLHNYAPAQEYQKGAPYVLNQYEIEVRTPSSSGLTQKQIRYPFQLRLMDKGRRGIYQDPNNNNQKTLGQFYLGGQNGERVNSDVLLNGQGVPADSTIVVTQAGYTPQTCSLPNGVQTDQVNTGNGQQATFLIYMNYAEQPFAALGLPQ